MKSVLTLAAVALLSLGAVAAPTSASSAGTNPADPEAQVPPVKYHSPFDRYRPFSEGRVGPWRDVNDEVGRIGGWKAYAREVFEANESAKVPASPPAAKEGPDARRDGAPRGN